MFVQLEQNETSSHITYSDMFIHTCMISVSFLTNSSKMCLFTYCYLYILIKFRLICSGTRCAWLIKKNAYINTKKVKRWNVSKSQNVWPIQWLSIPANNSWYWKKSVKRSLIFVISIIWIWIDNIFIKNLCYWITWTKN